MISNFQKRVLDKLAKEICVDEDWQNWDAFKKVLNEETGEFFPTRENLLKHVVVLAEEEFKKVVEEIFEERNKKLRNHATFVKPSGVSLTDEEKFKGAVAAALEGDSVMLELQIKKRLFGVEKAVKK